jgi:hypothetical protein
MEKKMSDIEKKLRELEERVERLEKGEKPYTDPYERINPYDLSQLEKIKNR